MVIIMEFAHSCKMAINSAQSGMNDHGSRMKEHVIVGLLQFQGLFT